MVPGDMYEWSRVIFAKKSKFHGAGGPDTVVSPGSSRFQPGEGPSRGLLRDYEPSDAIRMQLFEALASV